MSIRKWILSLVVDELGGSERASRSDLHAKGCSVLTTHTTLSMIVGVPSKFWVLSSVFYDIGQ